MVLGPNPEAELHPGKFTSPLRSITFRDNLDSPVSLMRSRPLYQERSHAGTW